MKGKSNRQFTVSEGIFLTGILPQIAQITPIKILIVK
jgi:hypothetical protein